MTPVSLRRKATQLMRAGMTDEARRKVLKGIFDAADTDRSGACMPDKCCWKNSHSGNVAHLKIEVQSSADHVQRRAKIVGFATDYFLPRLVPVHGQGGHDLHGHFASIFALLCGDSESALQHSVLSAMSPGLDVS